MNLANVAMCLKSAVRIYTALLIYGFAYEQGKDCEIPT